LLILVAVQWKVAFTSLGNYLICSSAPRSADLVLVLGGEFYGPRVLKAAELASQGYAPKVLISGPPYRGRPEGEFAIEFLAQRGYTTKSFESFGHRAHSTIGEAIALRRELIRRGVKRVILVTSAYHSRRAKIVLQLVCPGIDFISVPAPDPHYHPDLWWQDETSRRYFFSEWRKLLGSVFIILGRHSQ
jgi:uncharacterized SAM-binding protein YcdF (DUF218 family)